jgi:hypothetical protein
MAIEEEPEAIIPSKKTSFLSYFLGILLIFLFFLIISLKLSNY